MHKYKIDKYMLFSANQRQEHNIATNALHCLLEMKVIRRPGNCCENRHQSISPTLWWPALSFTTFLLNEDTWTLFYCFFIVYTGRQSVV